MSGRKTVISGFLDSPFLADSGGEDLVSQASRIFPCAHVRYGGGRGKGRKYTSGDYSMVFVSNGNVNVISAFGHAIIT